MTDYDVVVIGAGNGGISAALTCANGGLKTLLLEQHHIPGGCAGSFVRGRFEFEYSLHELSGVSREEGKVGMVGNLFDKLGVKIEWADVPSAYRVITTADGEQDVNCLVPFGGFDNVIRNIEECIPGSSVYTKPLFDLMVECDKALFTIKASVKAIVKVAKDYPNFFRVATKTLDEVEEEMNIPFRVRSIINAYWCYLGVTADKLDFVHFATMCCTYFGLGAVIPKARSHELTCAFLKRFEELGGEVWLSTKAKKIIVENGIAKAVVTDKGTITAKKIIVDMPRTSVYSRLIDQEQVPEREVKHCNSRSLGGQGFIVYMGLNKSKEELGLKDYSYFISPSGESKNIAASMRSFDGDKFMAAVCLNNAIPDCSPKGTTIVSLTAMFKDNALDCIDDDNYVDKKNELAYNLIRHFEKATKTSLIPYIEELSVASPATLAANIGSYNGIMYGYEPVLTDTLIIRTVNLKKDHPIKNLLFSGASGHSGHGYGASLRTGYMMGTTAIKEINEEANK